MISAKATPISRHTKRAHTHVHAHAHTHTHTHTRTRTRKRTHTRRRTLNHICSLTHNYTHLHTHAHIHTHTHLLACAASWDDILLLPSRFFFLVCLPFFLRFCGCLCKCVQTQKRLSATSNTAQIVCLPSSSAFLSPLPLSPP